jgi:hypothetical protein
VSNGSTAEIKRRVACHFSEPEWFTTFEFPLYGAVDTPDGKDRTIDALAISRIAGRGNEIHAIEVKTERSDWLKELATPAKAEAWTRLVDRFWIAAASGVVKKDEVPAGWGLLEESGSGLRRVVQARLVSTWRERELPDPIPREIWVRVLRRTLDHDAYAPLLQAQYSRGHADGASQAKADAKNVNRMVQYELDNLKREVAEFEKASGIKIERWGSRRLGEAVAVVLANEHFVREVGARTVGLNRGFAELIEALKAAGFSPEEEKET